MLLPLRTIYFHNSRMHSRIFLPFAILEEIYFDTLSKNIQDQKTDMWYFMEYFTNFLSLWGEIFPIISWQIPKVAYHKLQSNT